MKKIILGTALVATSIILVGCWKQTTTDTSDAMATNGVAKSGDTVKVDYVGTLEDGTLFDTSIADKAKAADKFDAERAYEPLLVNIGKNEVIPGFEAAIEGMKVGETKKITLTADEAYGQPRAELIQSVPADTFSGSDVKPEIGKTYNFGIAQGTVTAISSTGYTIDFNHPLAGKALTFEITLVEIMPTADAADTTAPTAADDSANTAPAADAETGSAETN